MSTDMNTDAAGGPLCPLFQHGTGAVSVGTGHFLDSGAAGAARRYRHLSPAVRPSLVPGSQDVHKKDNIELDTDAHEMCTV